MLLGSVRCHHTAVKWGGREKLKGKHGRARGLNVGLQRGRGTVLAQILQEQRSSGGRMDRNPLVQGVNCAQEDRPFSKVLSIPLKWYSLFSVSVFELLTLQLAFFFKQSIDVLETLSQKLKSAYLFI